MRGRVRRRGAGKWSEEREKGGEPEGRRRSEGLAKAGRADAGPGPTFNFAVNLRQQAVAGLAVCLAAVLSLSQPYYHCQRQDGHRSRPGRANATTVNSGMESDVNVDNPAAYRHLHHLTITHSATYSITHPLTHPLTNQPTHSCTCSATLCNTPSLTSSRYCTYLLLAWAPAILVRWPATDELSDKCPRRDDHLPLSRTLLLLLTSNFISNTPRQHSHIGCVVLILHRKN